ncbi:hypothetical protein TWF694_005786 [Orbilia ellipsospora]|uniref:methylated diphthine methylhydrolase n=1 Tax=Orbilia ellipsospora TaxID=2528407 RepID=A0AAV9WS12_9PEZI
MTRAVSSIYTCFLDAPPAACVSIPFSESSPDPLAIRNPNTIPLVSSDHSGNSNNGGGGGGDQGDGGSGAGAAMTRSFLVTGTYTLDKDTSLRHGSLLLHEALFSPVFNLNLHDTVPITSGSVLDIRLLSASHIVVATSTGQIIVYSLNISPNPTLHHISTHEITDPTTLLLNLSISPTNPLVLSATTNSSAIILFKFTDSSFTTVQIITRILNSQNGLEAWISAFSLDGNTLYSGGDDASFATWSASPIYTTESDTAFEMVLCSRNRRAHTAGVTAILPVTISEKEFILTGSYDQYIRIYSPLTRRFVGEMDLGGGVWRLEVISDHIHMSALSQDEIAGTVWILASCMHAGCRVLKIDLMGEGEDVKITVVAGMEEHESMNYASAVVRSADEVPVFVSTSFYDKRVCCWKV